MQPLAMRAAARRLPRRRHDRGGRGGREDHVPPRRGGVADGVSSRPPPPVPLSRCAGEGVVFVAMCWSEWFGGRMWSFGGQRWYTGRGVTRREWGRNWVRSAESAVCGTARLWQCGGNGVLRGQAGRHQGCLPLMSAAAAARTSDHFFRRASASASTFSSGRSGKRLAERPVRPGRWRARRRPGGSCRPGW